MVRGRDYGVQRWISPSSHYAGYLGADTCNAQNPSSGEPAVVVSPDDLPLSTIGDANAVAPGTTYPDAGQSHSGGGDSGGPILVGQGIASNGAAPTMLPAPASGDSYNTSLNYVAGTASLWVSNGAYPATAFNPTWTHSASTFLMQALHDGDGDGYADAVDDDLDNDGCDDDVDQHPDDRYVPIGVVAPLQLQPKHHAVARRANRSLLVRAHVQ
jgi:hypothetical protein